MKSSSLICYFPRNGVVVFRMLVVLSSLVHNSTSFSLPPIRSDNSLLVESPNIVSLTRHYSHSNSHGEVSSTLTSSYRSNPINMDKKQQLQQLNIKKKLRSIIIFSVCNVILTFFPIQHDAHAATSITSNTVDEGASIVTDSNFGKAVRKSTIQGARVIDNLDEKWERFSDSLRDTNKCDEATGRRLFDNGFRKDGTRIGNPVLGALCNPIALETLNEEVGNKVIDYGLNAAVSIPNAQIANVRLKESVNKVADLVRPSFERSITNNEQSSDDEKRRKLFNFAMYTNMKAINDELNQSSSKDVKNFYLIWGESLISNLAPNANRDDYSSPFPEIKDEFEDYDYDKNTLLDSLGMLNVALKSLQKNGLIGHYEISIPYDDYGSVVTIAVDDDITLGSQLLLREQGMRISGSFVESMVRYVMDRAALNYGLDSFFLDPSTTKQNEYNPTQLLLSLSNLRVKN